MTPSYILASLGLYRDSVSIVKRRLCDSSSADTISLDAWDMSSTQLFCLEFQNVPERETIILHLHILSIRASNTV